MVTMPLCVGHIGRGLLDTTSLGMPYTVWLPPPTLHQERKIMLSFLVSMSGQLMA